VFRLDGLVPNTPKVGSANKAGTRKKFETPSLSRAKAEPASSPPDFKTPYKPGEQSGQTYVEISSTQMPD
jgi:DNA polymerase alpha subunit B